MAGCPLPDCSPDTWCTNLLAPAASAYTLLCSPEMTDNWCHACAAPIATKSSKKVGSKRHPFVDCDALLPRRPPPARNSLDANCNSNSLCASSLICRPVSSILSSSFRVSKSFVPFEKLLALMFLVQRQIDLQTPAKRSPKGLLYNATAPVGSSRTSSEPTKRRALEQSSVVLLVAAGNLGNSAGRHKTGLNFGLVGRDHRSSRRTNGTWDDDTE